MNVVVSRRTLSYTVKEKGLPEDWIPPLEKSGVSSDIASEFRHSYELSYIRAHYFDGIEDGLFREAFQKELIRPDFSNPEHLACEKAFLLFLKPEGDFDYRRLHHLAGAHGSPNCSTMKTPVKFWNKTTVLPRKISTPTLAATFTERPSLLKKIETTAAGTVRRTAAI